MVTNQKNKDKIHQILLKSYDNGTFNGSVLVSDKGKIIYKNGFGLANMEWDIPNKSDTIHSIGSLGKQFTSMLIMQLIEKGKIKLEGTISNYLPYYPHNIGDKVTIYQLLTHTSGISNYTEANNFMGIKSRNSYQINEFILNFCANNLEFNPGTKFKYSNSGYYILGGIIEEVTKLSFAKVLEEQIFKPLEMFDTGYDDYNMILKKRASAYTKTKNGYENAEYWDRSMGYSAGSIYSTVEDLFKWDQALYSERLLSKKYMDIMIKPVLNNYACGWLKSTVNIMQVDKLLLNPFGYSNSNLNISSNVVTVMEHEGGIYGVHAIIVRIFENNQLIVLLNNTGETHLSELASNIIKELNIK